MDSVGFTVGYPPGGGADAVARALLAPLSHVAQRFEAGGLEAWPGSVEQLTQRMKEEQAVWPERLRKWGLSAE